MLIFSQLLCSVLGHWQTGFFSVRVSDSPYIVDHEDECVAYDEREFSPSTSVALPCRETKYGRYLSIQRTRGPQFHHIALCEVIVNGRPIGKQQTCLPHTRCGGVYVIHYVGRRGSMVAGATCKREIAGSIPGCA